LQEPPERPKGHDPSSMVTENFQSWGLSGESCPEGTVPIRRTTEQDMLRASSVRRFGRKLRRHVRRDTNSNGHEVSIQIRITHIRREETKHVFSFFSFPFLSCWLSLDELNNTKESGQTKW
jgi:hypothetical protein